MKSLLTVHASMSPLTENLSRKDIDRRDRRGGLRKVGYHFIITRAGLVEPGRAESEASMHDGMSESKRCLSVCLIGGADADGLPQNNFNHSQTTALASLYADLLQRHAELQAAGLAGVVSKVPGIDSETVRLWVSWV